MARLNLVSAKFHLNGLDDYIKKSTKPAQYKCKAIDIKCSACNVLCETNLKIIIHMLILFFFHTKNGCNSIRRRRRRSKNRMLHNSELYTPQCSYTYTLPSIMFFFLINKHNDNVLFFILVKSYCINVIRND